MIGFIASSACAIVAVLNRDAVEACFEPSEAALLDIAPNVNVQFTYTDEDGQLPGPLKTRWRPRKEPAERCEVHARQELQVFDCHSLVNLVDRFAGEAEFCDVAVERDKAGIRGPSAGVEDRRYSGHSACWPHCIRAIAKPRSLLQR